MSSQVLTNGSNRVKHLDWMADLIISSSEAVVKVLHKRYVKVWNNREWPDAWKKPEMVVLHKAGSSNECSSYRTSALLCHASKIMLIIILERIKKKIEEEQADDQSAYRKGRGAAEMLCCIHVLIEKTHSDQACYILVVSHWFKVCTLIKHQWSVGMENNSTPRGQSWWGLVEMK